MIHKAEAHAFERGKKKNQTPLRGAAQRLRLPTVGTREQTSARRNRGIENVPGGGLTSHFPKQGKGQDFRVKR